MGRSRSIGTTVTLQSMNRTITDHTSEFQLIFFYILAIILRSNETPNFSSSIFYKDTHIQKDFVFK